MIDNAKQPCFPLWREHQNRRHYVYFHFSGRTASCPFWTRRPTRTGHWITCSTTWRDRPSPSSAPFWRRRSLRCWGLRYCLGRHGPPGTPQTPHFRETGPGQGPAPGQPPRLPGAGRRPGLWSTPRGYTKNVDQLTTLLATAVTYDRSRSSPTGTSPQRTDLRGGDPPSPPNRPGTFHSASPCGALGIAAGAGSGLLEQSPLRGPPLLGRRHAAGPELSKKTSPAPSSRPRRRHLPGPPRAHLVAGRRNSAAKTLKAPVGTYELAIACYFHRFPSTPCSMPTTLT